MTMTDEFDLRDVAVMALTGLLVFTSASLIAPDPNSGGGLRTVSGRAGLTLLKGAAEVRDDTQALASNATPTERSPIAINYAWSMETGF